MKGTLILVFLVSYSHVVIKRITIITVILVSAKPELTDSQLQNVKNCPSGLAAASGQSNKVRYTKII
jgi:hypothetical protein